MVRIVQISDTHLSPNKRHFESNWQPAAEWVRAQVPDLVIHTGDVTVDGADQEEDFRHCAALMAELGAPFLAIPGNHDVGDAGHAHQPVNTGRIERWARYFGRDRWVEDLAGWRLIGFNALLIGSGIDEEAEQADWLAEATGSARGRRIAWFLHKPLFLENPEEGVTGYWAVNPRSRVRYLDLLSRHQVAVVASGHLHKSHQATHGGTEFVWGPSCGFVCGPEQQPPMPGHAELGAVIYDLDGEGLAIRRQVLPHLHRHVIDDVIHEVYPRPA